MFTIHPTLGILQLTHPISYQNTPGGLGMYELLCYTASFYLWESLLKSACSLKVCEPYYILAKPGHYACRFNLTISATDSGVPQITNYTVVTVRVIDKNDHAPVFLASKYIANITELTSPGNIFIELSPPGNIFSKLTPPGNICTELIFTKYSLNSLQQIWCR